MHGCGSVQRQWEMNDAVTGGVCVVVWNQVGTCHLKLHVVMQSVIFDPNIIVNHGLKILDSNSILIVYLILLDIMQCYQFTTYSLIIIHLFVVLVVLVDLRLCLLSVLFLLVVLVVLEVL